jgi:hypothetical protein
MFVDLDARVIRDMCNAFFPLLLAHSEVQLTNVDPCKVYENRFQHICYSQIHCHQKVCEDRKILPKYV